AAVGLDVTTSEDHASIDDNAIVNAGGLLRLSSFSDSDASANADSSTVKLDPNAPPSSSVGVGASVALNSVDAAGEASIRSGALVNAHGLTLEALHTTTNSVDTSNTFSATATSGAGAKNVGVAGAVALDLVSNRSSALVKTGASVNAGSGASTDDVTLNAAN